MASSSSSSSSTLLKSTIDRLREVLSKDVFYDDIISDPIIMVITDLEKLVMAMNTQELMLLVRAQQLKNYLQLNKEYINQSLPLYIHNESIRKKLKDELPLQEESAMIICTNLSLRLEEQMASRKRKRDVYVDQYIQEDILDMLKKQRYLCVMRARLVTLVRHKTKSEEVFHTITTLIKQTMEALSLIV